MGIITKKLVNLHLYTNESTLRNKKKKSGQFGTVQNNKPVFIKELNVLNECGVSSLDQGDASGDIHIRSSVTNKTIQKITGVDSISINRPFQSIPSSELGKSSYLSYISVISFKTSHRKLVKLTK